MVCEAGLLGPGVAYAGGPTIEEHTTLRDCQTTQSFGRKRGRSHELQKKCIPKLVPAASPRPRARCCRRCAAQPLTLHRYGHE